MILAQWNLDHDSRISLVIPRSMYWLALAFLFGHNLFDLRTCRPCVCLAVMYGFHVSSLVNLKRVLSFFLIVQALTSFSTAETINPLDSNTFLHRRVELVTCVIFVEGIEKTRSYHGPASQGKTAFHRHLHPLN